MRKLLWLCLLLACPSLAAAQGARVDNPGGPAWRNVQNFIAPIPGALITVCTSAGTGTPCTPLVPTSPVTLCTDATCAVAAPNPFPADTNGNWGAWLLPGTYKVSITANGVTGQLLTVTVPVTPSGNIIFTGQDSFSQPITSTVATGTAPFSIASTTVVPNLNAQLHSGLTAPASAIVGISDSQTLTNKSLTSPALTTPTIGGETVTSAPRGAFSGSAISLTTTGRVMQMPPDKAITVTSISFTVPPGGTAGGGCTQTPQVRVTDGTTLSSLLTLSNSSGGGSLTGLSVNYAAGADLRLEVAFNATGCSTNWANVNFVVQFKMQ